MPRTLAAPFTAPFAPMAHDESPAGAVRRMALFHPGTLVEYGTQSNSITRRAR